MKKTITILALATIVLFSCVQKEFDKKITLFVDTNGLENVQSIGVRGDFLPNKWRENMALTDENKDGIYEITFNEKTAVYGIDFKFVKNGNEFELLDKNNRNIVFEYKPETIIYKATFNDPKSEITKK
ncbi:MAG: hypothetical protein WAO74_04330 [Polaribacter sp.]|uniref:hypothetical protein n=1 Tax=Polaribacter sp. TaxID=1920175 RepID=UPI003BB08E72